MKVWIARERDIQEAFDNRNPNMKALFVLYCDVKKRILYNSFVANKTKVFLFWREWPDSWLWLCDEYFFTLGPQINKQNWEYAPADTQTHVGFRNCGLTFRIKITSWFLPEGNSEDGFNCQEKKREREWKTVQSRCWNPNPNPSADQTVLCKCTINFIS